MAKVKTDEERRQEYIDFMYNPDNAYCCQNCPENQDMDDWQRRLPCGQQNCWVICHCNR